MANFWRITKRNEYWAAIELKKNIPELKRLNTDDIAQRLRDANLSIITEQIESVPFLVRLTLPFGLILFGLLLISLPIKFMLTGTWGYKVQWLSNWFKALGF